MSVIIGSLILAFIFIGGFVALGKEVGYSEVVQVIISAISIAGLIILGLYLVIKG